MKIRELINLLEKYEKESDVGSDTEINFDVHPLFWTADTGVAKTSLEDVTIAYSPEKDFVTFELIMYDTQIKKLNDLKNERLITFK